ncbi:hypothetical protein ESA94_19025 [Lacibacter luteus]|uniref:Lipoprotein n=1 Tax=Lacibacter luteus TaxID=2508719 RepID=A0A4V1M738_9BACT|nr:hypothetical protein [Lacibacter luteus]RXK58105.1 hypothetical protein ESA94_19025 [Lacibacter luteus]
MTSKLHLTFGFFLVILVASCGSSDKKENPDKNEAIAKTLARKYNAVANWDTTASYTSHFQNMFIAQNKPILFKGRVYDIVKTDSNYVVKVLDERTDATHNFLAIITFSTVQLDSLYSGNQATRGVFVFKVTKVKSSDPSIKADMESDEDGSYTYTHLSDDAGTMITIFTGIAIDCQLEEIDESK